MIMKVSGVNNFIFHGVQNQAAPTFVTNPNAIQANASIFPATKREISEPVYQIPDFQVKIPTTYKKVSEDILPNGNKLYSYRLSNGYKVTIAPMEGSPAVAKTYVNVGSMNETADIKGISHFLEHMAFNGTNGDNGHIKMETGDSFKKIDALGGWTNASTNYALTDYVNSTPMLNDNDIETQIKILAAMTEDLKLSDEMIEKEKGPVSSEINMILDDPQTVAMDQTVRTLFNIKNPADELVGGSVNHIQNLTRKDVMDYYNKYYTPDNINIVVSGDVDPEKIIQIISKNFVSNKTSKGKKYDEKLHPIQNTVRKDFYSNKAKSAEIVLGFAGPKTNDIKERILFNIAQQYLTSNSVNLSKKLKDLNASYGIDIEKISTNPSSNRLVMLGITCSDFNTEKVLNSVYESIYNAKPITEEDLKSIKQSILDSREDCFEHSSYINNSVGNAIIDGNLDFVTKYNDILKTITPDEVNAAIKRIFDLNKTAITVIHPQDKKEVSFKGTSNRKPIKEDKISEITLGNNINLGLYRTKSNNFTASVDFRTDVPYNKKAGVRQVLDEIYTMGTNNMTEDEFKDYVQKNNISVNAYSGTFGIGVDIDANTTNYEKGLELANNLLYNPRITQDTLEKAKNRIKDRLERTDETAASLYNDYYAQFNPYLNSKSEILQALDSIKVDDVKEFHEYVINNCRGIVSANLPEKIESNVKGKVLNFAERLHSVKPNNRQVLDLYTEQEKPVVLQKANNNSQADIHQTYRFECGDTLKETATGYLMNSILSNSSIGLFNTLREKENLAYSVRSCITRDHNSGEITLKIQTTTDNKDISEQNFENVQRSINGFHRQIEELISGKFTEQDLENAKRAYKAMLLDNEGIYSKVSSVSCGLDSKFGITYENKLYNEIDNITKEDIINFAKKAFSGKPVYSVTATQDTLDANKEFFEGLTV